jgi:hypothetical protein
VRSASVIDALIADGMEFDVHGNGTWRHGAAGDRPVDFASVAIGDVSYDSGMKSRSLATGVLALGLILGVALPASAAPSHKAQQAYLRDVKGILPENNSVQKRATIALGEVTCSILSSGISIKEFVQKSSDVKSSKLSKKRNLVQMASATTRFCPHYHSEVEQYIQSQ